MSALLRERPGAVEEIALPKEPQKKCMETRHAEACIEFTPKVARNTLMLHNTNHVRPLPRGTLAPVLLTEPHCGDPAACVPHEAEINSPSYHIAT